MFCTRKFIGFLAVAGIVLSSRAASAYEVIAHRGVFHDIKDTYALPENSYASVTRAYDLGLKGVELDLRLDASGNVVVTHDMIMNRTTKNDGNSGVMNPIDIALNIQSAPSAIWFDTVRPSQWSRAFLKIYGRDGKLFNTYSINSNSLVTELRDMLSRIKANRSDIASNRNFMIVLDVQDSRILTAAGSIIKDLQMTNNVYLEFFASKAISNDAIYSYNGSDTCYNYAKRNNLSYVKIIPQINDGELDIYDDNNLGVYAFGRTLPIDTYLQCWADAQTQHADAAQMPIVSASVPAQDIRATAGARQAIRWAQSHSCKTMTIVPNPDAGRRINGTCRLFSFQSTKVGAVSFNMDARKAKTEFASDPAVNPDFIVWDVMGNAEAKRWDTNFDRFTANLC
jgi:hypothetical protein